jgi:hypothetical protein
VQHCQQCEKRKQPIMISAATQTNIAFDDISWCNDAELKNKKLLKRKLTQEEILNACKFYTGKLCAIFSLSPYF